MNLVALRNAGVRIIIFVCGFLLIAWVVYALGKLLVPLVDGADKAILAACNPDEYVPVLDQFMRALTDYTNFLIAVPLFSCAIASLLYRFIRKGRIVFTGLLAVETLVMAALAVLGKIWPNKTYIGANVFLVIGILVAFGAAAIVFHRMNDDAMRRFFWISLLALLSGFMAGTVATERIKKAVARPRPLNDANKPWNEHVRVIPDEVLRGRNSYPSGHTAGTFGLLTPLFWYIRNRKGRAALIGWGVLQGYARVYTVAHFPFCCIMGAFLGFSVGTLIFFTLGGPSLREMTIFTGGPGSRRAERAGHAPARQEPRPTVVRPQNSGSRPAEEERLEATNRRLCGVWQLHAG